MIFRGDLNDPIKISEIQNTISRDDVQYIILDRYSNRLGASKLIVPSFNLVQTCGDFEIYRKSSVVSR
jgi:hypothetical protein